MVCLESGLGCVASFGESPDFLKKQKSRFFGNMLFKKTEKNVSLKADSFESGFYENHCIGIEKLDDPKL